MADSRIQGIIEETSSINDADSFRFQQGTGSYYDRRAAFSLIRTQLLTSGIITATELASNAVTTSKILNANVTNAKMANDSVDTDNIVDDAVDADKLAVSAVETLAIKDANVTLSKLDSDAKPFYVDGTEIKKVLIPNNIMNLGNACTCTGIESLTFGENAKNAWKGALVYSGGMHYETGDAQAVRLAVRGLTTDNSGTNIYIDSNSSYKVTLDAERVAFVKYKAIGVDLGTGVSGSKGNSVCIEGSCKANNSSGTIAIPAQSARTKSYYDTGYDSCDVTCSADTVNNAIQFTATGLTDVDMRWTVDVEMVITGCGNPI